MQPFLYTRIYMQLLIKDRSASPYPQSPRKSQKEEGVIWSRGSALPIQIAIDRTKKEKYKYALTARFGSHKKRIAFLTATKFPKVTAPILYRNNNIAFHVGLWMPLILISNYVHIL